MIIDWSTFRELARQGHRDGVICLTTIASINQYFLSREIASQLMLTGADKAADVLFQGACVRLHLIVSRAFATTKNNGDRHLRVAINFLVKDRRLDEEPNPVLRKHLIEAVEQFQALEGDPRLKRIVHMRNKLLAHWATYDPSIGLPDLFEIFAVAREATKIWENLAIGSGADLPHMVEEEEAHRKSADVFWSAWNLPAGHPGHKIIADYEQLR
ncbi:hypothetical protein [Shinella sp. HZN7]|uniref:AbiU2 domain-containing protein n=1 Tax=Shinella sp. (strain HZN7) TaxID=879274 RepID=UPI000A68D333|nr:hypothetical protein [Shinella sp. HZN7]